MPRARRSNGTSGSSPPTATISLITFVRSMRGVHDYFETKRKILGENAARLYGIDIAAQTAKLTQDGICV